MKPPMPVGVIVTPAALQKTLGDDASRDLASVLKETVAASAEAAASSVSVEVSRLAGAVGDLKEELKGGIARVEGDLWEVKDGLRKVKDELKTEVARVEDELRTEIAQVKDELRAGIARVEAGLRTEIGRAEENLRSEFATNLEAGLYKTKGSIVCWVVGLALAQAALTVALFQLLR